MKDEWMDITLDLRERGSTGDVSREEPLHPLDIVLMLYDGMVEFLVRAIKAINDGAMTEKSRSLSRVIAIIEGLYGSIDAEAGGQVAGNLGELYCFLMKEVSIVDLTSDVERLRRALDIIITLRDAWREVGVSRES
ncbi:MAG TPA: flagellar export chaperone FliS [Nitrospirae bacterium]|nr:flagellar export chaperone FliS [Nitrospirota bacterium]